MSNLFVTGVAGMALTIINALFWLIQGLSERQYRFIGDGGADSFKRMWLNIGLAILFAVATCAAWFMEASA